MEREYRGIGLPWPPLEVKAGVGADNMPALRSSLTIAASRLSLQWPLSVDSLGRGSKWMEEVGAT